MAFLVLLVVYFVSAAPVEKELLEAEPEETLKTASSLGYGYGYGGYGLGLGLGHYSYYPHYGYNSLGSWGM